MKYEVELKFRLNDLLSMESRLRELKSIERGTVVQVDRYFNHPSRDFRTTDEAFRIRSINDRNRVTYKGAVIGSVAKTRHEIEVSFADGAEAAQKLIEIVDMLGFHFVREVRKTRRSYSLAWCGRDYDIALDDVPPVGQFLEIELTSDGQERERTEAAVWNLATQLGLSEAESRTYLQMLLESDD